MKRVLVFGFIAVLMYACGKETDPVYDSHLFQALQAKNWVFDYATVTDSLNNDTTIYPADTIFEIHRFNSQQYIIRNFGSTDSLQKDTAAYQIIYNSPDRIFFYDPVSQQITLDRYMDIDTVNANTLILTKTDTPRTVSRNYFHAR